MGQSSPGYLRPGATPSKEFWQMPHTSSSSSPSPSPFGPPPPIPFSRSTVPATFHDHRATAWNFLIRTFSCRRRGLFFDPFCVPLPNSGLLAGGRRGLLRGEGLDGSRNSACLWRGPLLFTSASVIATSSVGPANAAAAAPAGRSARLRDDRGICRANDRGRSGDGRLGLAAGQIRTSDCVMCETSSALSCPR